MENARQLSDPKKNLLSIHAAVALFGFSGLFAKFLDLSPITISLGRVVFSSVFLISILKFKNTDIKLKEKKEYLIILFAGIILAVHWTTFLKSIQTSTVAIGTFTFSTFPLFITFLEPYFFKERLKASSIATSIAMLAGVMLMIPEFEMGNSATQGVIWGMVSSFTYAALALLNRNFSNRYSCTIISFYEQATAAIVLFPSVFILKPSLNAHEVGLIILLGIVFTAISHSLFINGLKRVKAQTAGIISSMEPVYGIIAAMLFLGEVPGSREIGGGAIILGVVIYSTISSKQS